MSILWMRIAWRLAPLLARPAGARVLQLTPPPTSTASPVGLPNRKESFTTVVAAKHVGCLYCSVAAPSREGLCQVERVVVPEVLQLPLRFRGNR